MKSSQILATLLMPNMPEAASSAPPVGATRRRTAVLAVALALLASCVADTMRGYVGQDVRQVELAYGPPSNVIDLGNGARAYQWTRISVSTTPASAVTTSSKDKKGRRVSSTQLIGGQQSTSRCVYTFFTAWSPQQNGWIVTGIRQPSLDCAIGGLDSG
jgi:predicted small secreted protein